MKPLSVCSFTFLEEIGRFLLCMRVRTAVKREWKRLQGNLLMQGNRKQNMLNHISDGRIIFHLLLSVGEFHSQSFKTTVTTSLVYRINNRSGTEGSVYTPCDQTRLELCLCLMSPLVPTAESRCQDISIKDFVFTQMGWKCTPIARPDSTTVSY